MMIRHPDMTKRGSIAAALIILLSGCMLGPDYRRPAVTTPDAFRGASAAIPPDKQSIAELKWFEVFQDEQLQELVRTALAQNYDLRDAVARVDAARANLGITQAEPAASAPLAPSSSICFPLSSTYGADCVERRKRRAPIYWLRIGTEKPSSQP